MANHLQLNSKAFSIGNGITKTEFLRQIKKYLNALRLQFFLVFFKSLATKKALQFLQRVSAPRKVCSDCWIKNLKLECLIGKIFHN